MLIVYSVIYIGYKYIERKQERDVLLEGLKRIGEVGEKISGEIGEKIRK
jgi:hypothetical protein